MSGGVNGFERSDGDMRVDFGGFQTGVTKHLLNVTNFSATLQHQGGHGVTEQMARSGLADVRRFDVVLDQTREMIGDQLCAVFGEKE